MNQYSKTFEMTGGKGLKMQWGFRNNKDPKAMDWDKVFRKKKSLNNLIK